MVYKAEKSETILEINMWKYIYDIIVKTKSILGSRDNTVGRTLALYKLGLDPILSLSLNIWELAIFTFNSFVHACMQMNKLKDCTKDDN